MMSVEWGHNTSNTRQRKGKTMRLSKERKQGIAWKVANDWVEFASRILGEGLKPVKFSDHVELAINQELFELCERKGDTELVYGISRRVRSEIKKLAIESCRVQVSVLKK